MLSRLILRRGNPQPPKGPIWMALGVIVALCLWSLQWGGGLTYILGVWLGDRRAKPAQNLPVFFKSLL